MKVTFINAFLRAVALLGRFLFIVTAAKHLSTKEMADYGLLSTLLIPFIYAVGLEFYAHANREFVTGDEQKKSHVITNQTYFYICAYLFFAAPIFFVAHHFLDRPILLIFLIILPTEHIFLELYRLLVSNRKPIPANILLSLKNGLWCYVVVITFHTSPRLLNLEHILFLWATSNVICLIFTLHQSRFFQYFNPAKITADKRWIYTGLQSSKIFLGTSITLQTMPYVGRFYLTGEKDELAVYTLFQMICSPMIPILSAGVISVCLPDVISAWKEADPTRFTAVAKRLRLLCASVSSCLAIALVLIMPSILEFIGKADYASRQAIFIPLLAAAALEAYALAPRLLNYGQGNERSLFWITIAGMGFYIFLIEILNLQSNPLGLSIGLVVTNLAMLAALEYQAVVSIRERTCNNPR